MNTELLDMQTRLRRMERELEVLKGRVRAPNLYIGAKDTDPTFVNDGHMWYRTDLAQLRMRLNGATVAVQTKTRTVPIISFAAASADGHGTLNAGLQTVHEHFADAATSFGIVRPFKLPDDGLSALAGTWTLKWMWSSSVASNDVRFGYIFSTHVDGATANVNILNGAAAYTAPGVADTMIVSSVPITTTPAAGSWFSGYIRRDGTHVADTNTGQVSLWGSWLEYQQALT